MLHLLYYFFRIRKYKTAVKKKFQRVTRRKAHYRSQILRIGEMETYFKGKFGSPEDQCGDDGKRSVDDNLSDIFLNMFGFIRKNKNFIDDEFKDECDNCRNAHFNDQCCGDIAVSDEGDVLRKKIYFQFFKNHLNKKLYSYVEDC